MGLNVTLLTEDSHWYAIPDPKEKPVEERMTAPETQIVLLDADAVPPILLLQAPGTNSSAPMSGTVTDLVSLSKSVVMPLMGVPWSLSGESNC